MGTGKYLYTCLLRLRGKGFPLLGLSAVVWQGEFREMCLEGYSEAPHIDVLRCLDGGDGSLWESYKKKIGGEGQICCQQQTKGQVPVWVLRHGFSLSPAVVFAQGWAQVHCSTPLFRGLKTCAGACYHVHQWIILIIWKFKSPKWACV